MVIIKELRGVIEALAITMWCKGAGRELDAGEYSQAEQAVQLPLNEGPWQSIHAIALGISASTIMMLTNEVNARGLGSIPPDVFAEMLQRLPVEVVNHGEIEVSQGIEDEDEDEGEDEEAGQ